MFGTILPDLMDKPLYYLALAVGHPLTEIIPGTRTIAHTGMFLFLVLIAALIYRNKDWLALSLGLFTHFVLDAYGVADHGTSVNGLMHLLFWPFYGYDFPSLEGVNNEAFWKTFIEQPQFYAEVLGGLIVLFLFFKFLKKSSKKINKR